MKFILRDTNVDVVRAWRETFAGAPDVSISCGEIFEVEADAIVSPANSFGFMDGGIDLVYLMRFGTGLQDRLRARLREQHDGELPVGEAVVIETGDEELPLLISAPTMRVPMDVSKTVNAYLAFRAAIRAARAHNARGVGKMINTLLCPGLGTAIGATEPDVCARQMHLAFAVSHLGHTVEFLTLGAAAEAHRRLRG
jgi:O-acetyl-ADP-ribose deacetylase (regulator of RNase III)